MWFDTKVSFFIDRYDQVTWKLKFALIPHRCDKTGQKIWFKYAYQGTRNILVVPSGMITERCWITKDIWLIEKLKGKI